MLKAITFLPSSTNENRQTPRRYASQPDRCRQRSFSRPHSSHPAVGPYSRGSAYSPPYRCHMTGRNPGLQSALCQTSSDNHSLSTQSPSEQTFLYSQSSYLSDWCCDPHLVPYGCYYPIPKG